MYNKTQDIKYGQRTIASVIDDIGLKNDPSRVFVAFLETKDDRLSVRQVTYKDMSKAISRAAWWLEEKLGGRGTDFPTIAYMGPNDILYLIFAVAANKAGYKLLLPSPKNTSEAFKHIFEGTDCHILLKDKETQGPDLADTFKLQQLGVPQYEFFLDGDSVRHYPEQDSSRLEDPILILHSSGSTGPPKIITWNHLTLCCIDQQRNGVAKNKALPIMNTFDEGDKILNTFPLFHTAGITMALADAVYYNTPNVLPPPRQISARTIVDCLKHIDCPIIAAAPSVLEQLVAIPDVADTLKHRTILYGGGPLDESTGNKLAQYTRVVAILGSTETGRLPLHDRPVQYWNSLNLSNLKGLDFRKHDENLYELVIIRDPETDKYHSTWQTFPEEQEYHTKDLFSKHPDDSNLWVYQSRLDDVITLSTGEKITPGAAQTTFNQLQGIKSSLIIGQGKTETALMLELDDSFAKKEKKDVLNEIQDTLSRANEQLPDYGHISTDRILFTDVNKPMTKNAKGSIVRKKTLGDYSNEIEELYEDKTAISENSLPEDSSQEAIERSLSSIIGRVSSTKDLDKDQDFFSAGLTSLEVVKVLRQIKASLPDQNDAVLEEFTPDLIYSNATLAKLAGKLKSLHDNNEGVQTSNEDRVNKIENLIANYEEKIRSIQIGTSMSRQEGKYKIILTGSTGSLGSYILDTLINSDEVEHIYTLNRAEKGEEKQRQSSSSRNLSINYEKVTFMHTTLDKDSLGLLNDDYEKLKRADTIIHCQWPVNFNMNLDSFGQQIAGVYNLIKLSAGSRTQPHIFFLSTVASTGNWSSLNGEELVPEKCINDARVTLPMGYAESKHVGERILQSASQMGLKTSIARIGQLAGPVERIGGVWSKNEWLPSLIASSNTIKKIPDDLEDVDWIPVDIAATIIVDLTLFQLKEDHERSGNSAMVYNIVNPNVTKWKEILKTVLKYLGQDQIEVVRLAEWIGVVLQAGEKDTENIPAYRLAEFFKAKARSDSNMARMQVKNGLDHSETMSSLVAVQEEWVKTWMKSWGFP